MNENDENIFITAQIIEDLSNSLDLLQDVVVPYLLETVIKGHYKLPASINLLKM